MSVNRISPDFQHSSPKSLLFDDRFQSFNINQYSYDDGASQRRAEENNNTSNSRGGGGFRKQNRMEAMFEKSLTPSDVGKLNRLVIPKLHAERHFSLGGDESNGTTLLSFEDEAGKLWRFRYSYWNSSQSYVFTKGWSRFVKEKRLGAGDVVLFERHPSDPRRLFIGWRRGPDPSRIDHSDTQWAVAACSSAPRFQPDPESSSAAAGLSQKGNASSGTLRLFGVNMEYQIESDQSEPAMPDGSSTSSPSDQVHHQYANYRQPRQ